MTYVYQEYPKWLAEGVIVNNAEEEKAVLAARRSAESVVAMAAGIFSAPALEEVSKGELLQFAERQHIKVNKYATKTELIAEIRAAMQKAKA